MLVSEQLTGFVRLVVPSPLLAFEKNPFFATAALASPTLVRLSGPLRVSPSRLRGEAGPCPSEPHDCPLLSTCCDCASTLSSGVFRLRSNLTVVLAASEENWRAFWM